jgi:hypothetical protein
VDKALELYIAAPLSDGRDFSDRQLARENDALKAKFAKRENTLEIMGDKLGRSVKFERREMLPRDARDAEVLNDDGRRPAGGYDGKLFDGTLKITLVNHGIKRDINLLTLGTRIAHEILKFLARKIFRERPSGKFGQRTVNRIGPRAERSQGRIEITGGGEKFRAHKPPKSSVAK